MSAEGASLLAQVAPTPARIVGEQIVYSGWTQLRRVALAMPDGALVERHIERHGAAAVVLPYDPVRRTALLVSMPRAPVIEAGEPDLLEAIAGALGGDAPDVCARREAMEEAGVALSALETVGHLWSMPTLSTERLHLFLAAYAQGDRVGAGGGLACEHENIMVQEIALDRLRQMARDGDIADLKTLVLVQALEIAHPELFGQ